MDKQGRSKEYIRNMNLKKSYGINLEDYANLLAMQDGQ